MTMHSPSLTRLRVTDAGRARTRSYHDDLMRCHEAGMTAFEAAAHVGLHHSTVFNWAQALGLRFFRRRAAPPAPTLESKARLVKAHAAAMERRRKTPVNGWTWEALMDAGYTACEAARIRGQSSSSAYQAEKTLGRKFARAFLPSLSPAERRKLRRVKSDYGVREDDALRIIGREDLIGARPKRPSERERLIAQIKADPEAALLAMMKANVRHGADRRAQHHGAGA